MIEPGTWELITRGRIALARCRLCGWEGYARDEQSQEQHQAVCFGRRFNRHKEPDVMNIEDLENKVQAIAERLNASINRASALEQRVGLLESGRTGQVHGDPQAGYTVTGRRHGPPPGVPLPNAVIHGKPVHLENGGSGYGLSAAPHVEDATTERINALIAQRDVERARVLELVRERDALAVQATEDTDAMVELRRLVRHPFNGLPLVEAITKTIGSFESREREAIATSNATKRAQLADLEWNAIRVQLNPLILPEFQGQTLGDAIASTVHVLTSRLSSAQEAGQRAHADAQRIRGVLEVDAETMRSIGGQIEKAKRTRAGHLSTIADQARQIGELREALAQEPAQGAASLHRQASTWEQTRKERRLIEDNEELREGREEHRLRVAQLLEERGKLEERAHLAEGKLETLEQRGKMADPTYDALRRRVIDLETMINGTYPDHLIDIANESFGPFPVLTVSQAVEAIASGITWQRFALERRRPLIEAAQIYGSTIDLDASRAPGEVFACERVLLERVGAFEKSEAGWLSDAEEAKDAFLRRVGAQPETAPRVPMLERSRLD